MKRALLSRLFLQIGWWFAPPRCPICQNLVRPFHICCECAERERSLRLAKNTASTQVRGMTSVFSRWKYQDEIRNAILEMKFSNMPYQAENFVLLLLSDRDAYTFIRQFNIIIWVPATRSKRMERGYLVPYLLAKSIARLTGVALASENVLQKIKETPNQVELSGKQRRENLKGAFAVMSAQEIEGKRVLIIDDVLTTGTTLHRIAELLTQAGAKEVAGLVLAESVPKMQKESMENVC